MFFKWVNGPRNYEMNNLDLCKNGTEKVPAMGIYNFMWEHCHFYFVNMQYYFWYSNFSFVCKLLDFFHNACLVECQLTFCSMQNLHLAKSLKKSEMKLLEERNCRYNLKTIIAYRIQKYRVNITVLFLITSSIIYMVSIFVIKKIWLPW